MSDHPERITPEQIAELVRLEKAATPGLWQMSGVRQKMVGSDWHFVGPDSLQIIAVSYSDRTTEEHCQSFSDAKLIPLMKNTLPALLREVMELREALGAYQGSVEEILEVAALRGDNDLPHPADDPKRWSSRMQEAWNGLANVMDDYGGV